MNFGVRKKVRAIPPNAVRAAFLNYDFIVTETPARYGAKG